MAGTLYIVATPIGNLEDMPPRVAATFGAADFIAAEEEALTQEQAAQRAFALTIEGFSASAAAKTAAQGTAYSKSEVYKQLLLLQQTTE